MESTSSTYQRRLGAAGIEGQLYEINLNMLLMLKAKIDPRVTNFYLSSNLKTADSFDDVVYTYKDDGIRANIVFMQAKHNRSMRIKSVDLKSLLSGSEKGDFSLLKYFRSYRKIKKQFSDENNSNDPIFGGNFNDCEFRLYTNLPFRHDGTIIQEFDIDDKDLLIASEMNSTRKYFQIEFSKAKEKIMHLLENTSDCRRLAIVVAAACFSDKGIDVQLDIVKSYHRALQSRVFQQITTTKAKLRETFLKAENDKFRNVFFEEAAKLLESPSTDIMIRLNKIEMKVSNKFWEENCPGSLDLPDNDPNEEDEVKEFFNKFRLYPEQPSQLQLENEIKKIVKDFYKIDERDISLVFATAQKSFQNWWMSDNYYLHKDNKFFENAARVEVQFDVMEPVTSFEGREKELQNLHEMLQDGGGAVVSQCASVIGLGGVGKSELARKYLSMYKSYYDNNIIWINAENPSTIATSFRKLAQEKLSIRTTNEDGEEREVKHIADDIYDYFHKVNRRSIFVFDNAEKQQDGGHGAFELLPSGLNKPYVLITSRKHDWGEIQNLQLDVFTKEEATHFIGEFLKEVVAVTEDEVQSLANELGNLPLALRQAVAYISKENERRKKFGTEAFTIRCYLRVFNENAPKVLSGKLNMNHDRYTKTVLTTWTTTLEKIQESVDSVNKLAVKILHVIAYLAPDGIAVKRIFGRLGDLGDVMDAVELLEEYSMVVVQDGKINVHRLVQQVTRIRLGEQGLQKEVMDVTFILLSSTFPYGSDNVDDIYVKRSMMTHFESFLVHVDQRLKDEKQKDIEKGLLAQLLILMGDGYENQPHRKKQLLERALEIEEKHFGPDHFEVAKTLADLGVTYGSLGDVNKQKLLLERALPLFEKHYGPDHFEVAKTLANLGNTEGLLGDINKKKLLLERALPLLEKHYGPDHFEVARTLMNLGVTYGSLGDVSKQKLLLERALKIQENHYGPDHFEVARTLVNLGNAYGSLGDVNKQKLLLERALKIQEKHYGPDHFEVARTLVNLGNAYGSLGDVNKQKLLLERALEIKEKHFGPDHFEVAATLANLGVTYGSLGDVNKQKLLLERALPLLEKHYGPDHFEVAATLANLGKTEGSLGDVNKQKLLLERALEIEEKHYGPDHFEVARTLVNLGIAYGSSGDVNKQKQLLERALVINEKHYGPDHFEVAVTLVNLGNAYGSSGDVNKQKLLLERALEIQEKHYGPDHFEVAKTLANLGNTEGSLGDVNKQKLLLERALPLLEKHYGPYHFEVAKTLANLGNTEGSLGDVNKKKLLLERALPLLEKHYGPDHFVVATTLANLGNAYGSLGDVDKQKLLLERALPLLEKHYGPDHFVVATTLMNLGVTYGSLGDVNKQKQLLERALEIEEKHYGPDHFEVARTLVNLSNAYRSLGDVNKQKLLLERALDIKEKHYGPDYFEVAGTLMNLGDAYGSLGDVNKQKLLLERALEIQEKHYGPDHFEVAATLANLGVTYGSLGDVNKKKLLLERALEIQEKHYGPDHFLVAVTLANLGNTYGSLGDKNKQKQLLERALEIQEKHYGPDHFLVAVTLANLGNTYGSLGDKNKQKLLLERALPILEKHNGPDHFDVAVTKGI